MISRLFYVIVTCLLLNQFQIPAEALGPVGVGVTYSILADNLPPAKEAIPFAYSKGFKRIRIYEPHKNALDAIIHTTMDVILGVGNEDIVKIAYEKGFAQKWVDENVKAYNDTIIFSMIAVGHDISPEDKLAEALLPAMQALQDALPSDELQPIPVVTPLTLNWLENSHPPSAGEFRRKYLPNIKSIVQFMELQLGQAILCDLYPYYAMVNDPAYAKIPIEYALLSSSQVIVQDGNIGYTNLLDGLIDAFISALEKIGQVSFRIYVGATGWPIASGSGAKLESFENAETYTRNVVSRMQTAAISPKSRTPSFTYLYNLYLQNQATGIERDFGLFYPNNGAVFPNIQYNMTPIGH
ncbi:hypothetical protein MANES_17G032500v8 [Manihot esculenta]|uniref:Uncharacterized protein n=3 Tax=Manihot esculenta TaxID=3983 RepID=A0ACB7G2J2_MANES|nr:hypothetical protein MANES_17G032500v8 [Manihot esculenta]